MLDLAVRRLGLIAACIISRRCGEGTEPSQERTMWTEFFGADSRGLASTRRGGGRILLNWLIFAARGIGEDEGEPFRRREMTIGGESRSGSTRRVCLEWRERGSFWEAMHRRLTPSK